MKPKILCENAKTKKGILVCSKSDEPCAFQTYRRCRGWWENTEGARKCKRRTR